jgi:hypothetical protein
VDVQWRGRWLEVMGCGMVDPAVLEGLGLDPERWSGFAAGLGVERFCMVRHGIDDIRRLFTSDLRFSNSFKSPVPVPVQAPRISPPPRGQASGARSRDDFAGPGFTSGPWRPARP